MREPRIPNVAGGTPAGRHLAVLTAFEQRDRLRRAMSGDKSNSKPGQLEILERHAPASVEPAPGVRITWCGYCTNRHPADDSTPWPCPDFVSAAAGLVTGLAENAPERW